MQRFNKVIVPDSSQKSIKIEEARNVAGLKSFLQVEEPHSPEESPPIQVRQVKNVIPQINLIGQSSEEEDDFKIMSDSNQSEPNFEQIFGGDKNSTIKGPDDNNNFKTVESLNLKPLITPVIPIEIKQPPQNQSY